MGLFIFLIGMPLVFLGSNDLPDRRELFLPCEPIRFCRPHG
jgi:hypothetical protein